jgi:hypothetical protein
MRRESLTTQQPGLRDVLKEKSYNMYFRITAGMLACGTHDVILGWTRTKSSDIPKLTGACECQTARVEQIIKNTVAANVEHTPL